MIWSSLLNEQKRAGLGSANFPIFSGGLGSFDDLVIKRLKK
jgi:hypothetical protein